MKNLKKLRILSILFVGLVLVTSCSNDDDGPAPFVPTLNVVQIVQNTPQLEDLETALLKYPNLINTLSAPGTFTVFAPTNDAFDDILAVTGQSSIDDLPEDVLENILQYHVYAAGAITSASISAGLLPMVNGEEATVTTSGGVFIDNAQVIAPDGIGTNGVVHLIDAVIVPPSILPIVGTIVAPAYFNKNFTTLIAAVQAADPSILALLLGNGPTNEGLTLFAPTNDAFEAAGITDLTAVLDVVDAVLAYHVVNGTVLSTDLPMTTISAFEIPTLGGNIYLSNNGNGSVNINGKTQVVLESTDIMGSNGVVHVIDRTLIPPTQDIVEIVSEFAGGNPAEFTLLAAALTKANLIGALQDVGPFTVFAPTDTAFLAAGVDQAFIDAATPAELEPILLHHVVEPSVYVFSSDVADGAVPMMNGTDVTITGLTIQDGGGNPPANLVPSLLDVHATNGVIHVIDKVLLP